jgi:hypothetical protein
MRRNHPLLPKINKVIIEEYVYFTRVYRKYMEYKRPSYNCTLRSEGPKALGKLFYIKYTSLNCRYCTLLWSIVSSPNWPFIFVGCFSC